MNELDLLTVDDVASLFKVKPSWIYDQVEARAIPFHRLNRTLRFSPCELIEWLASTRVSPVAPTPNPEHPKAVIPPEVPLPPHRQG